MIQTSDSYCLTSVSSPYGQMSSIKWRGLKDRRAGKDDLSLTTTFIILLVLIAAALLPGFWKSGRSLTHFLPAWLTSINSAQTARLRQHAQFESWLNDCGGSISRSVALQHYGNHSGDFGLFATSQLSRGSTVARVPHKCLPTWRRITRLLQKGKYSRMGGRELLNQLPGFEGELFLIFARRDSD